jgi:hypothetical protein
MKKPSTTTPDPEFAVPFDQAMTKGTPPAKPREAPVKKPENGSKSAQAPAPGPTRKKGA